MSTCGIVKFFNAQKGFGFIEHSGGDVFVHRNQCVGGEPQQGDQVSFRIELGKQGKPQATNVTGGTAPANGGGLGGLGGCGGGGKFGGKGSSRNDGQNGGSHFAGAGRSGLMEGIVKFFNVDKGYGFIQAEGYGDVFLHRTQCVNAQPVDGDRVVFEVEIGARGTPQAVSCSVVNAGCSRGGVSFDRGCGGGFRGGFPPEITAEIPYGRAQQPCFDACRGVVQANLGMHGGCGCPQDSHQSMTTGAYSPLGVVGLGATPHPGHVSGCPGSYAGSPAFDPPIPGIGSGATLGGFSSLGPGPGPIANSAMLGPPVQAGSPYSPHHTQDTGVPAAFGMQDFHASLQPGQGAPQNCGGGFAMSRPMHGHPQMPPSAAQMFQQPRGFGMTGPGL